ncbi:MAG: ribonuclease E/G, partial [Kineosporiaceae bacterium]
APAPAEKRPARKRASRKKVADAPAEVVPATEPVAEPVAGPDGPADPPAPEAGAEAAPAVRKRRRAPKAAAEAARIEVPAEVAVDPAQVAAEAVAEAVAEEAAEEDDEEDDDEAAADAATRPVFAMPLFQAPEPAAPRTRRAASRPAGPPVVDPATDEATVDSATTDATPDEAEAPAPARRTRRTRGRAATQEEPVAEAAATEVADPDTAPAEAEAEDSDDDDEDGDGAPRRRRRRGGRGRRGRTRGDAEDGEETGDEEPAETGDAGTDGDDPDDSETAAGSRRRRRRRRRGTSGADTDPDDPPNTVVRVRESRRSGGGSSSGSDVTGLRGSTRLEAKKQRRREGREAGRRRPVITEAEFLARRESVDRVMVVREREGRTQIGVLEDGVLVEHYVARRTQTSMVGNVYLGRVQNVLPSMEAAFIDIGKGRNAVLYAGEVNWDAAGLEGQPRRIEHALKSGESVLVQVTKDPIGHKGARLTSQVSLPGRYLVYVPDGSMTGISRKLPDIERNRLKKILRDVVPDDAGVIVRTAAEGASAEELERDVARLAAQWEDISRKTGAVNAPALLYGEPDLAIRVVRDIFNEDFARLVIDGDEAWEVLQAYIGHVAPDLVERVERWEGDRDVFAEHRIDEQLAKALDRKVWLPSGGSLVIDRTEAMTVVDVNTGKFTGSGGNLEETVTKNNIEAAEEIVRQLRLRDIGGIIVVDFIDMVLESNRDLVLRRLLECLGRDRTKHQVAEVTSLGLVQMTRKRVGQGLLEVFSENCEHCGGRGIVLHDEPVEKRQDSGGPAGGASSSGSGPGGGGRRGGGRSGNGSGNGSGRSADKADKGDKVDKAGTTGTTDVDAGPNGSAAPAADGGTAEGEATGRRGRRGRGNRSASSPAGPPAEASGATPSAVAGS